MRVEVGMRRTRSTAWILLAGLLCALLSACSSGSSKLPPTTGGGGGTSGAPNTNKSVPQPNRDSQGYDLGSIPLNAVPNGDVSALGAAPTGTDSLAALTPGNDVIRVSQNAPVQPAETTLGAPGRSVAATSSQVFVATRQRGTPGMGDVYLREETSPGVFTWSVALDSASDVALVATTTTGAVAAIDSAAGQPATLYRYDVQQRTFVAGAGLGAISPTALTSWPPASPDVYVGGTTPGGGAAQLLRVRATAVEVLSIPSQGSAGSGEREEVTGFAWAKDNLGAEALLIVTATFDANGVARDGQLLLYDGTIFSLLSTLSGDGATALAFTPESQVYVGTATGKLLYYDPSLGLLQPEPGFPAVSRVSSLLARDSASLLIGCQTSSGALLVVRTRRSP
jgi:hypothetical protein